jgi:hypothetical protein
MVEMDETVEMEGTDAMASPDQCTQRDHKALVAQTEARVSLVPKPKRPRWVRPPPISLLAIKASSRAQALLFCKVQQVLWSR